MSIRPGQSGALWACPPAPPGPNRLWSVFEVVLPPDRPPFQRAEQHGQVLTSLRWYSKSYPGRSGTVSGTDGPGLSHQLTCVVCPGSSPALHSPGSLAECTDPVGSSMAQTNSVTHPAGGLRHQRLFQPGLEIVFFSVRRQLSLVRETFHHLAFRPGPVASRCSASSRTGLPAALRMAKATKWASPGAMRSFF